MSHRVFKCCIIKKMKKLFLILFISLLSTSYAACPPKLDAIDCIFSSVKHSDNGLSTKDLDAVAERYLPWYTRIVYKTFGGSSHVMSDCDMNSDGYISRDEAVVSSTCMETCDKRLQTMNYLGC